LIFFLLQYDECVHKIKKIVHLIEDDYEIFLYFDFYILLVDFVQPVMLLMSHLLLCFLSAHFVIICTIITNHKN